MADRVLLVANRGEVAVRVARTAAELGIPVVAVHTTEDGDSMHVRLADRAVPVPSYLDVDAVVGAATATGATHLHPGWGFLAEDAALARGCAAAGVVFVGPSPEALDTLGDKAAARALAAAHDVPVLPATDGPATLDDAVAFARSGAGRGGVVVKAVAGGGGRGLRVVTDPGELPEAYTRARSEAEAAFGRPDVYVEALVRRARHVEVQIVGDGTGAAAHLGERDCTLQRRHQKVAEITPAPGLDRSVRAALHGAAVRLASAVRYRGVGTFEFLVDAGGEGWWFIEANARLQVEHTVTEELYGIDLVALQLAIADGALLDDLDLPPAGLGFALQCRLTATGPGRITALDLPAGPGVRVDTGVRTGDTVDARYDPLLAKVIVRSRSERPADVWAKAARALAEVRVDGVPTDVDLLRALAAHPDVVAGTATTDLVDRLAVAPTIPGGGDGTVAAPLAGVVVAVEAGAGAAVRAGTTVVVLESMKMEHLVAAGTDGVVREVLVGPGDNVTAGDVLAVVEPAEVGDEALPAADAGIDPSAPRADVEELAARRALLGDEARPAAVERRRRQGHRTVRENIADLVDPGSFEEWGGFAVAAQAARRGVDDLIANTPADGLVTGVGRVNGQRCAVVAYDYTVLAGTQGQRNHAKKDRIFELVARLRLPLVLFAEGGGGRPGDTDVPVISGLETMAFRLYAELSGLVPLVGIVQGRCFAGNAALLGCSDVIIATEDANIGMGGPAMIEGGGLGVYRPEDVGPVSVQAPNGVIDVVVPDDEAAVRVAKQYLSYFQGPVGEWECADQRLLRHLVPENRLRVYDVRQVVETLADTGSVLELRRQYGVGIVTALARIEGRPIGILANNPAHLGGAIDAPAADKAARFVQLCDAFDLPVLALCDTPGFMVGPEAERDAQVRRFARMFVQGASATVPYCTIVLRKGYGLGAQAMAAGSFRSPIFTVSWPTGEFGGMGLEGAVRLGYRRELEAVEDPEERAALEAKLIAAAYERGRALNMAMHFELDDVIDPADSRRRVIAALDACPPPPAREGKKRPCVDPW